MTKLTKQGAIERDAACDELREWLKPGDTVSCILRSVSRSGMSREISFVDKEMRNLDYPISKACGYRFGKQGLKVGGCGMDMGFAVVYELGHRLWPKGTDKPHGTRNGEPDSDGGYALKQRWL